MPVNQLCPEDAWRAALKGAAPAGFTVSDAIDQIDAPLGWVRRGGDRGVRFELRDEAGRGFLIATLMPEGFEGRCEGLGIDYGSGRVVKGKKAHPRAGEEIELPFGPTKDGYVLFLKDVTGGIWKTAEADVAQALGARKVSG